MKPMRPPLAGLALVLSLVVAPAGSAQAPPFESEVSSRLGGDANGDGIIDGALDWQQAAEREALDLLLTVRAPECDTYASARWFADGTEVPTRALGGCRFALTVAAAGTYEIGLAGPGEAAPSSTETVTAGEHLVVSIGDSVASGEGNPDRGPRFATAAAWLDRPCHRSMLSGQAQAALQLERGERGSAVTFVPLGCSGATIARGLLGPYGGIAPRGDLVAPPQVTVVNALAARREIDAVLVSVGANDVGFSKVVRFCIFVTDCPDKRFDPETLHKPADDEQAPTLSEFIASGLAELRERYDTLDAAIADEIPRERILAVEYFDPTTGADGDCQMFDELPRPLGVTGEESAWARTEVLAPLNETLADAAIEHGWTLVDGVAAAFQGHGECAREDSWVVGAVESIGRLDEANLLARLNGTLHPNEEGHLATARLIRAVLADLVGAEIDESLTEPDPEPDGGGVEWWLVAAIAVGLLALAGIVAVLRSRPR